MDFRTFYFLLLPVSHFSIQLKGKNGTSSAKYISNIWKDGRTLSHISDLAKTWLVPVMDYEISHVHYVVLGQRYGIRRQERSYLFVCIVMLSSTKNVRGGDIVLTGLSGKIVRKATFYGEDTHIV